jgi:hypothetical protein
MTIMNISLDLETWGTNPGCDIRSIGAVVFNPATNHIAERNSNGAFYIALDNPVVGWNPQTNEPKRLYPLARDPKTEVWWEQQSEAAQAAFSNPVDLLDGLMLFKRWFDQICPRPADARIWSHGAHFDVPILEAAFKCVGYDAPWHYRSPRDTRTVFEQARLDPDTCLSGFAAAGNVHHHALDDATTQARAIVFSARRIAEAMDSWEGALDDGK